MFAKQKTVFKPQESRLAFAGWPPLLEDYSYANDSGHIHNDYWLLRAGEQLVTRKYWTSSITQLVCWTFAPKI